MPQDPRKPTPQQALDMWGAHTSKVAGGGATQAVQSLIGLPGLPRFNQPTDPNVDSASTSPFANKDQSLAPQSLVGSALSGVKNAFGSYDQSDANSLATDADSSIGKIISNLFSSRSATPQQPASGPPIPDPAFPKDPSANIAAASQLGGQAPMDTHGPPNVYTLSNGQGGQVSGLAKYGGPQLNTPGALKDFSAGQYQPPKDSGISLEELFKIAGSPQNQTFTNAQGDVTGGSSRPAGASDWANEMLSRRLGEPSDKDLALLKVLSPEKVANIQGQSALGGEQIRARGASDVAHIYTDASKAEASQLGQGGGAYSSVGINPRSGAFHVTAANPGGAGERSRIDGIIAQLNRDHLAGVLTDDEYTKQLDFWNQRYGAAGSAPGMGAGMPGGQGQAQSAAPQDVSQFVGQLRQKYPHATAQQLMQVIEDPNGEYQGFDSDADRQILLDAFHKNGIQ